MSFLFWRRSLRNLFFILLLNDGPNKLCPFIMHCICSNSALEEFDAIYLYSFAVCKSFPCFSIYMLNEFSFWIHSLFQFSLTNFLFNFFQRQGLGQPLLVFWPYFGGSSIQNASLILKENKQISYIISHRLDIFDN